jgi:hypothetical protein
MPGKRVQFDEETLDALNLLAKDRMMTFQELADEAFRGLLRKHGRPLSLREALRRSSRAGAKVGEAGKRAKKSAVASASGTRHHHNCSVLPMYRSLKRRGSGGI